MKTNYKFFLIIAFTVILFSFTGCAYMRGELDITVPEIAEPEDGPKVQIMEVVDNRIFELKPSSPSIPSLKDGQIEDKEMTSRAISRKRNGFGMAQGDIFLSEGRTVEQLIKETIEEALEEKGYTVVEKSGPDVATMTAEIQKFWVWITPGFWTPQLDFQSELMLSSSVLKDEPSASVESSFQSHPFGADSKSWINTILQGLENLRANIMAALKDPN